MEQNLEHVLEQLKANQFTKLNLNAENLTNRQVIDLAEVLKYNQSLSTLKLSNNQLGAAEAEKLSETRNGVDRLSNHKFQDKFITNEDKKYLMKSDCLISLSD